MAVGRRLELYAEHFGRRWNAKMRAVGACAEVRWTRTSSGLGGNERQFDIDFRWRETRARINGFDLTCVEICQPERHSVRVNAFDREDVLRVDMNDGADVSDPWGARHAGRASESALLINRPDDPNEVMVRWRHLQTCPANVPLLSCGRIQNRRLWVATSVPIVLHHG